MIAITISHGGFTLSALSRTSVAVAAMLTFAVAPVLAASSATASIGSVSITLFDLNPSDNLPASLSFFGESSASYVFANGATLSDVASGFGATTAVSLGVPFVVVSGSTGDQGAQGSAAVSGGDGSGNWLGGDGQGVFAASFEVGAWTGVLIEMSYAGTAKTTVGQIGSFGEAALSSTAVNLNIYSADGLENHNASRTLYASSVWNGSAYTGQDLSFNGNIRLTYANLSDVTLSGSYTASAYANASSAVPVPEPATSALMLLGLAGMAGLARRRR
jgi:hypothetical protein